MYSYRPLTHNDLPLLFEWMSAPHVKKWWDTEPDWQSFHDRYARNIEGSSGAIPFLVLLNGEPLGYLNYWFVKDDPNFAHLYPPTAIGIDQLIGDIRFIAKGHGSAFIREFTDELLGSGKVPLVMTDPHPENQAAIRAYLKAGFKIVKPLETREGPVLLMEKKVRATPAQP